MTVWTSGNPYPNAFWIWGATYTDPQDGALTYGCIQVDTLADPVFITGTSGTWGYVQILDRTEIINGGSPNSIEGLDTDFPYPCRIIHNSWTTANGTTRRVFFDAPGRHNLGPYSFTYSYDAEFKLYIMYLPPDSAAGDSAFVPIRMMPWTSRGHCASTAANGPWTHQDDGSAWSSGATDYPSTFPDW